MLQNKKILLITVKFFNYEQDIRNELIRQGASVDFVLDRPFNSGLMKALTKISPAFMQTLVYVYYQIYFPYIFKTKYDYVFVVEGITLSRLALQRLKKSSPECIFILYVWDSVKNRHHIYQNSDCYHKILTFDPEDAKRLGYDFRPLFFTREFESTECKNINYDLCFIGTVHSDRYEIVKKLSENLFQGCRKFLYLYFHEKWYFHLNRLFKKSYRESTKSEFSFNTISKQKVIEYLGVSSVILDIEHPHQTGLTMRTFEVMAQKRKLATTNVSVRNYDFYNPNNILIIDRKNPVITKEFFLADYQELPSNIYHKYTLEAWVSDCFKA